MVSSPLRSLKDTLPLLFRHSERKRRISVLLRKTVGGGCRPFVTYEDAPQGDEVGFGILVKQNMDSLPQGDGGGLSSTNSTQLSSPKSFIGYPDHTSKLSGFPFAWE